VAYVNLDTILFGNFSYEAVSSPLLYDLIFDVIKSIEVAPNESVFDRWVQNDPDPSNVSRPL
jgi:hypothetical protein